MKYIKRQSKVIRKYGIIRVTGDTMSKTEEDSLKQIEWVKYEDVPRQLEGLPHSKCTMYIKTYNTSYGNSTRSETLYKAPGIRCLSSEEQEIAQRLISEPTTSMLEDIRVFTDYIRTDNDEDKMILESVRPSLSNEKNPSLEYDFTVSLAPPQNSSWLYMPYLCISYRKNSVKFGAYVYGKAGYLKRFKDVCLLKGVEPEPFLDLVRSKLELLKELLGADLSSVPNELKRIPSQKVKV